MKKSTFLSDTKYEHFESILHLWGFQNFQEESLRRKDVTDTLSHFICGLKQKN